MTLAARLSSLALAAALAIAGSGAAYAAPLMAPLGARWGMSPQDAQTQLSQLYKFVGPTTGEPEAYLLEQRYSGDALGLPSDHISPLFFLNKLFGMTASWSPSPEAPASYLWEQAVSALTRQIGKPKSRTRPLQLLSLEAILRLMPESANKGQLTELFRIAESNGQLGAYVIMDLQIQVGSWVPDALWEMSNGVTVQVVMRAGPRDAAGLMPLKPTVIYTKPDVLRR